MDLGAIEIRIFASIALILAAMLVAAVVDLLKANAEALLAENVALRARRQERLSLERLLREAEAAGARRTIILPPPPHVPAPDGGVGSTDPDPPEENDELRLNPAEFIARVRNESDASKSSSAVDEGAVGSHQERPAEASRRNSVQSVEADLARIAAAAAGLRLPGEEPKASPAPKSKAPPADHISPSAESAEVPAGRPQVFCSQCGSNNVEPSLREGANGWLLALIGIRRFRCRDCNRRFGRPQNGRFL